MCVYTCVRAWWPCFAQFIHFYWYCLTSHPKSLWLSDSYKSWSFNSFQLCKLVVYLEAWQTKEGSGKNFLYGKENETDTHTVTKLVSFVKWEFNCWHLRAIAHLSVKSNVSWESTGTWFWKTPQIPTKPSQSPGWIKRLQDTMHVNGFQATHLG